MTVIEVLSPTNKKTKEARAEYLKKRDDLDPAHINFVEIDLLRAGEPMPARDDAAARPIIVSWFVAPGERKDAVLYAFPYTSPIPPIPIPLLPGDPEPELDSTPYCMP